jgi:hypothetical protein
MVGKHPAYHYLLPALSLSGLTVFLLFYLGKDLFTGCRWKRNYPVFISLLFITVSFILFNPVKQILELAGQKTRVRDKSLAVYRKAEQHYADYAKIYYYASSSPAYAIKFGNDLARNTYAQKAAQLYNDVYFYDFVKKKFFSFDYNQRISLGLLRTFYRDKILFQGPSWVKGTKVPGLKLKKVYGSGSWEAIFLVDPERVELTRQAAEWIESHLETGSVLAVPGEWGAGVARLQQDYRLVPLDYKNIAENLPDYLALLLDKPYFLVPGDRYYGKSAHSQKSQKRLTNVRKRIKIEDTFPDRHTPLFFLGRLDADRDKREKEAASLNYEEIKVWFPAEQSPGQICPALQILGRRGTFALVFRQKDGENLLEVANTEAGDQGKRICLLGFAANRQGFDLSIPGGKILHLLMDVELASHPGSGGHQLFIQDYLGKWERKGVNVTNAGRWLYLVSKKIRPQSAKLQLGILFSPQSAKDKLIIRSINVFITREQR